MSTHDLTTTAVVRFMTWNVWWRFGGEWSERELRVHQQLQNVQPDIVGLQESWARDGVSQADVLAEELGMHAAFAGPSLPPVTEPPETPEQEGVELGVALLSRWPIIDTATLPLPSTHRPFEPVALRATVDHPAGPLHVITAATEWEPSFGSDHRAQARHLAKLLSDPALDGPLPVVLLADLNAAPGSAELDPLLAVAIDTWAAVDGDPDARTLRSEHPFAQLDATAQMDRRIDHVLVRHGRGSGPVDVRDASILGDPIDGLHPSDHDAVVVDIALPTADG